MWHQGCLLKLQQSINKAVFLPRSNNNVVCISKKSEKGHFGNTMTIQNNNNNNNNKKKKKTNKKTKNDGISITLALGQNGFFAV